MEQSISDRPTQFTCTICYLDDISYENQAIMPCCHNEQSSMNYCRRCIELICENSAILPGIGRCPTCFNFISINNGKVSAVTTMQCRCCCQQRQIIQSDLRLCESCTLGRMYTFQYECQRCHRVQMIPHPMWRYQPTPLDFSTATWACGQRCHDYTHWKILNYEIESIPIEHCPESWGRREDWLSAIRTIRRGEIRTATAPRSSKDLWEFYF